MPRPPSPALSLQFVRDRRCTRLGWSCGCTAAARSFIRRITTHSAPSGTLPARTRDLSRLVPPRVPCAWVLSARWPTEGATDEAPLAILPHSASRRGAIVARLARLWWDVRESPALGLLDTSPGGLEQSTGVRTGRAMICPRQTKRLSPKIGCDGVAWEWPANPGCPAIIHG